jgi:hypothetical protein
MPCTRVLCRIYNSDGYGACLNAAAALGWRDALNAVPAGFCRKAAQILSAKLQNAAESAP